MYIVPKHVDTFRLLDRDRKVVAVFSSTDEASRAFVQWWGKWWRHNRTTIHVGSYYGCWLQHRDYLGNVIGVLPEGSDHVLVDMYGVIIPIKDIRTIKSKKYFEHSYVKGQTVPNIGRPRNGSWYRHPSNKRTRSLAQVIDNDEPKMRDKAADVPNSWDDNVRQKLRDKSWKRFKKAQYL